MDVGSARSCIGGERHHIKSFRTAEQVDPVAKVAVGEYKLICAGCGQSLEEIHSLKKTRKPRSKKNGDGVEAPATEDAAKSLD
jgi:hypothetical protein